MISSHENNSVETCQLLCEAERACVEFALGKEGTSKNRCDLFKSTLCTYSESLEKFDIYRVVLDCGWQEVRYAKNGEWHLSTDTLAGTDIYGRANDKTNSWSIDFS